MILLLQDQEDCSPHKLLAMNVAGYLFKKDVTETLIHVIRAIVHGQDAWLSRAVVDHLVARLVNNLTANASLIAKIDHFGVNLTKREMDLLELIVGGHENAAIAQKLCLSPKTVRNQTSVIYGKFGVHSRGALLKRLQESGAATG